MKIKQAVLNRFNSGGLSISMEGCCDAHYHELFSEFSHSEDNENIEFLYGFKFFHKINKGKGTILGWMEQPQNKNCIHYSQIWEEGEDTAVVDMYGLFYVFLPGKQTPQKQYESYIEAIKEAERLCKKEKQIAYVCEVKAIVEPSDEVKITYR